MWCRTAWMTGISRFPITNRLKTTPSRWGVSKTNLKHFRVQGFLYVPGRLIFCQDSIPSHAGSMKIKLPGWKRNYNIVAMKYNGIIESKSWKINYFFLTSLSGRYETVESCSSGLKKENSQKNFPVSLNFSNFENCSTAGCQGRNLTPGQSGKPVVI